MEISALLETRSSLLWTLMHKALALHDMVLVVLRCRSCAAFLPGRSSLFHAYSFAARPPHRCHTNPKSYRIKQTAPNHAICPMKTNPPNERSILTIRELPRDAVREDSREAASDSRCRRDA